MNKQKILRYVTSVCVFFSCITCLYSQEKSPFSLDLRFIVPDDLKPIFDRLGIVSKNTLNANFVSLIEGYCHNGTTGGVDVVYLPVKKKIIM